MRKQLKSIVTDLSDKRCYLCGYGGELALHHMIPGIPYRKKADKDQLTCWLCVPCHTALHDKGWHRDELAQIAQKAWMEQGHTVEEWRERYTKSYL